MSGSTLINGGHMYKVEIEKDLSVNSYTVIFKTIEDDKTISSETVKHYDSVVVLTDEVEEFLLCGIVPK